MIRWAAAAIMLTLGYQSPKAQQLEQSEPGFGWTVGYMNYRSYSQQKTDLPMRSGYPVITGQIPTIAFHYMFEKKKSRHHFQWRAGKPFLLSSDNGTGRNHLLVRKNSHYFRSTLSYRVTWPLWTTPLFSMRHGLGSGILYENRILTYIGGSSEKTGDLNFFAGPALSATAPLGKKVRLYGDFDAHFHLPYLNYGKIRMYNSTNEIFLKSSYFGFYYQAVFRLGARFQIPGGHRISFGLEKNNTVGYAGSNRSFSNEGILHYKLNRILGIFFHYHF